MTILWTCGLPEEVRVAHPVTDVPSAAWSWIIGHLPPPKDVVLHIICPVFGMNEREAHFEYGGAQWHCFRLKRWEPLFLRLRFYWSIRAFVKKLKPDVVHGWGGESGCGLLATYCSPFAVVSVQGLLRMLCANARRWHIRIPESRGIDAVFRRWTEAFTYKRAHKLLVEGEASRDWLKRYYGLEAEIVPHPLRREFVNREIHAQHGRGVGFLFIGQMTARKGPMDVLEAFASLECKAARLAMIGSGDQLNEVMNYVRAHGLQDRVRVVERCGANELLELMNDSCAFLVPSYGDTGPTALKEALSQGLYPIGYCNTGVEVLIKQYGFGEVVTTGDVNALSAAMAMFCSSGYKGLNCRSEAVARQIRADLDRQEVWKMLRGVYNG